jgi:predicted pyridoxine 5'-phosphate oxidase superfamily flavin-nucleotide-binding protein
MALQTDPGALREVPSRSDYGHELSGERILQRRHGTAERARRFAETQLLDHLNPAMRDFIARQEMMFLATSDADGTCDNSFRSGPAGFVHTFGAGHLAWPEYRGNGVLASLGNITTNPHVGLLFVDFFADGVGLHVNGAARLLDDYAIRAGHPDLPHEQAPGRRPEAWVLARVEEAYIHCSKFIPRLRRADSRDADRPRQKKPSYFVAQPQPAIPRQRRPLTWPTDWS